MMAQVKGIYASGTESRKKKTTATGVQAEPVVTATPVQKPVKPATVTVPAQTVNAARQEQIRDQRYRRAQSEPVGAGVSGQSKPQTLPVTDEEINRIWYADDPRYQRSQKIREMQEPKSPEAALLDGYWYDDDPDY